MRPLLFRPPFLVSFSVSAFSGFDFVTSAKSETVMKRRPGVVGLNLILTGIRSLRSLEDTRSTSPGAQLHDGLLPARAACP